MARHSMAETADRFRKTKEEIGKLLAEGRSKLFVIRSKRPRPHLDDKIVAAWNGLMISAYARAAQVLAEPRHLSISTSAADFLGAKLYDPGGRVLYRTY